ncbi:serine hydrolase-domain-containing protein [Durotheca rogersii]|uniref:serine hydrolase-domain-containing protein n=1 Tax=Durotheca rogersii TaxID=419775 RepID=UPI002220B3D7|nr:serine hydrolase-domain-containing protein [Durotheca rogersii]KAI5867649.1 serine hydrolase-domain-containing protein [Durotheca rogersii]
MKILCIHGTGSNGTIMQMQIAALRYELEDGHEYDFVEAVAPAPMSEDVASLASPDQDFYAFYHPVTYGGLRQAIDHLDAFVTAEGPYDAVMGFSAGSVLAALYLLETQQKGTGMRAMPFRYGLFFSSAKSKEAMSSLGIDPNSEAIQIPTIHIWGDKDEMEPTGGKDLSQICLASRRTILVHEGGHEFPRDMSLTKAVHAIRRTFSN